eukprot:3719384-Prymnesium_polylepis.1
MKHVDAHLRKEDENVKTQRDLTAGAGASNEAEQGAAPPEKAVKRWQLAGMHLKSQTQKAEASAQARCVARRAASQKTAKNLSMKERKGASNEEVVGVLDEDATVQDRAGPITTKI